VPRGPTETKFPPLRSPPPPCACACVCVVCCACECACAARVRVRVDVHVRRACVCVWMCMCGARACACELLAFNAISDPDLDSGWIQGVCADILSYTWPVRGGDQPRTTPMPFQRISTDLCGSPDHINHWPSCAPKSRDSGTGNLGHQNAAPTPHSRHPTRPGSCAAETTALGPTGAHLGGLPGGGAPAPGAPCPGHSSVAMHKAPRSARGKAEQHRTR
jgi:hypothetical protein